MSGLPQTLAVTGAGGFIGLRMVERCVSQGIRVQGLEVSPEAAAAAAEAGAEITVGDVRDRNALRKVLSGADAVFHTAAIVSESGDPQAFNEINVEGTRLVAEEALNLGIQTLVHLSSVMVYGFDYPEQVTEDHPLCAAQNVYIRSKIDSEAAALSFNNSDRLRVVAVRAGDVYGPRSMPWTIRPIKLIRNHIHETKRIRHFR